MAMPVQISMRQTKRNSVRTEKKTLTLLLLWERVYNLILIDLWHILFTVHCKQLFILAVTVKCILITSKDILNYFVSY